MTDPKPVPLAVEQIINNFARELHQLSAALTAVARKVDQHDVQLNPEKYATPADATNWARERSARFDRLHEDQQLELVYAGLREVWDITCQALREPRGADVRLRIAALRSIEARLATMLQAAGKLPM